MNIFAVCHLIDTVNKAVIDCNFAPVAPTVRARQGTATRQTTSLGYHAIHPPLINPSTLGCYAVLLLLTLWKKWRHLQNQKYITLQFHKLSSEEERTTTTGNMYRNVRELWTCCFWLLSYASGPINRQSQTGRQTDTLIAILRTRTGCEVWSNQRGRNV